MTQLRVVTEIRCLENANQVIIVTEAGEIELTREGAVAPGHPGLCTQFERALRRKKVGLLEINTQQMRLDFVFDNLGLGRAGRTLIGQLAQEQVNFKLVHDVYIANTLLRSWAS